MNYREALNYLNSFINYEKTPPKSHAELNLARMRAALDALDHPEKKFFPILIAGTVGKGSTGYFLEQILEASKIPCGFYHSPHVDDVRERIRVRGKMFSEKEWALGLTAIRESLKKNPIPKKFGALTYFEALTLLAIWLFARADLRVGIFEIGMGGRLDATNVLEAPLCLITKIDFDHQAFLGNTLEKIATEKAGIIKKARFVVSVPQEVSALRAIKKIAAKQKSRLVIAKPISRQPGLEGEHQKQNAGNAFCAAEILNKKFDFNISKAAINKGLAAGDWKGRLEKIRFRKREIVMDAAHNPAGCRELVRAVATMKKKPKTLVFSALRDKDSVEMIKILSALQIPVIVAPLKHARAKKLADLAAEAEAFFDRIIPAKNTGHALEIAIKNTRPGEAVLVTGSFYLLSEARGDVF